MINLISNYVKIKKYNNKYWIKCLFHKENNPSLLLNKNNFYCFGCKKIGNNTEILNLLLKKKKNIIEKYFELLKKNSNKYQIIKLFSERNFYFNKIFKKYNNFSICNNVLLNNFSKSEIKFLIKNNFVLKRYKRFYIYTKLLIIPIRNIHGKLVTFVIKKEKPKYLFLKKIIKYKKSEILYGFYENRKYIEKSNNIFVVEGFFDIYRLNYIGVMNSVALLGCNISNFQINFIMNLKKKIFLVLDNDLAARNSLINFFYKNYNIFFYKYGIKIVKIRNDPDIFFKNYNKKKFLKYLKKNSYEFIDFFYVELLMKLRNFFYKNFCYIYIKMKKKKNKKNFLNNFLKFNKIKNIKKFNFFFLYYKKVKKKMKYSNYILHIIKHSLKKKKILKKIFNFFKNYKNFLSKIIFFKIKYYKRIFFYYKVLFILNKK